ncbi:MAG: TetR/AcrR family transcriptional regulator [Phycisphaerae bacterium]|nr:TetR/AcrR family transcriptional regulator [Phycisphaerae bacterium]
MGTRERREREKDAVRQKIMDAARELFVQEGYEAVSIRRIADAIEYSPAAIYVHFRDKADLMKELCGQDFESFADAMFATADEPDPVERIWSCGAVYLNFAIEHPNHFRLMFMTKPSPETMETDERKLDERGRGDPQRDAYAFLVQNIKEAIALGQIREELQADPELVAQVLWACIHGIAALHVTRPEDDRWLHWRGAENLRETMMRAILQGVLREPGPSEPDAPSARDGVSGHGEHHR